MAERFGMILMRLMYFRVKRRNLKELALFGGMVCGEQIGSVSTDVCLLVFHIKLCIWICQRQS